MKKIIIVFVVLLLLAGCIGFSGEMVSSKVIDDPCSVLTTDELESICGYDNVVSKAKNISLPFEVGTCLYYFMENGEENFFIATHFERGTISYKDYKTNILSQSSEYEIHILEKENLGMGDNSFLIRLFHVHDERTNGYDVNVFRGSSMFSVANYNPRGNYTKCFTEEDTMKIAKHVYSNLNVT